LHRILVFYGSYRSDRTGIRLAHFLVRAFTDRGDDAELIDAKAIGLPLLDRMYKEYAAGSAPPAMAALAGKILTSGQEKPKFSRNSNGPPGQFRLNTACSRPTQTWTCAGR
jgi:hypothetical protein